MVGDVGLAGVAIDSVEDMKVGVYIKSLSVMDTNYVDILPINFYLNIFYSQHFLSF